MRQQAPCTLDGHSTSLFLSPPRGRYEYEETRSFLYKQLKADPRLRPSMVEVKTDHLSRCLSCENDAMYRRSVHPSDAADAIVAVGLARQPLVDDHTIHEWRNTMRFLQPPSQRRVVMRPSRPPSDMDSARGVPHAVRFGCPCAAELQETSPSSRRLERRGGAHHRAPAGRPAVRLWHTAEVEDADVQAALTAGRRPPLLDEHRIVAQLSADGAGNWSAPRALTVDGVSILKSFVLSSYDPAERVYYAGYEGRHWSLACLAGSDDGD